MSTVVNNKIFKNILTVLTVLILIYLNQINADEHTSDEGIIEESTKNQKIQPVLVITPKQKATLLIIFIVIIIMSCIAIFINCYVQMRNEKSDEKVRFSEIQITSDVHMWFSLVLKLFCWCMKEVINKKMFVISV